MPQVQVCVYGLATYSYSMPSAPGIGYLESPEPWTW